MAERFAVFRPFLFWQRDVLVLPLPASTVGQADGAALMADDADTAMAEPRPWLGSHVSLAQFKVLTTFAGHESAGAQTLLRTYFLVTTLLSRNRTWRKEKKRCGARLHMHFPSPSLRRTRRPTMLRLKYWLRPSERLVATVSAIRAALVEATPSQFSTWTKRLSLIAEFMRQKGHL